MIGHNFLSVASQHAEWASVRRTVIATNIANANTPGYKARDAEAFAIDGLQAPPSMQTSHAGHLGAGDTGPHLVSSNSSAPGGEYQSGNNVSLDRELMKAGSVSREQNLNAGLMKAFNRLIALSTRG